ncbi:uncharacterized protein [Lolium perenne]|uniref:uncharacterized protein isoform X2 n=1 Tax=Lolium perenne TaxID=4522 RepID=UPI003A9A48E3
MVAWDTCCECFPNLDFKGSQQALSIENDHIHDMFSHRMAACRRNSQMSGAPQYSPRSSTHAVAQVMPIPLPEFRLNLPVAGEVNINVSFSTKFDYSSSMEFMGTMVI